MMAAMIDLFCDSSAQVPARIVLDIDDTEDEVHVAVRRLDAGSANVRRHGEVEYAAKAWPVRPGSTARRVIARVEAGPQGTDTRFIITNLAGSMALCPRWQEDATLPTMATDGRTILYNRAWCDEIGSDKCMGVIAHEVLHVANKHHLRRGDRDPKLWSIAADLVINTRPSAHATALLRHAPARAEDRHPRDPGAARAQEARYDRPLHPRRPQGAGGGHEPARASRQGGEAARVKRGLSCPARRWRSRISSAATGRRGAEPTPVK
jgi:Putative metallopeptidase domain